MGVATWVKKVGAEEEEEAIKVVGEAEAVGAAVVAAAAARGQEVESEVRRTVPRSGGR